MTLYLIGLNLRSQLMSAKKKTYADYDTNEEEFERDIALRVYVNKGEKDIIHEALMKLPIRNKNVSGWASKLILTEACRILGIEYPYKD